MPIIRPHGPLCGAAMPDALFADLAAAVGGNKLACGIELEHRGACIFLLETATHIVQISWWKHNFRPIPPHRFVAELDEAEKCSTCGHPSTHPAHVPLERLNPRKKRGR